MVLVLIAPIAAAQVATTPDATTAALGEALRLNEVREGVLSDTGRSFYSLTVPEKTWIQIELERREEGPFNPVITLADQDGFPLITDEESGGFLNSRIITGVETGTYQIIVRDRENRVGDPYRLVLSSVPDIRAAGIDIHPGSFHDGFLQPGRVQLYLLTVQHEGTVQIDAIAGEMSGVEPQVIVSTMDGFEFARGAQVVQFLLPGTYALLLQDRDGRTGGEYRLTVSDPPAVVLARATPILPGQEFNGYLFAGDRDLYRLIMKEEDEVIIEMVRGEHTNMDPFLTVYHGNGNWIADDDDGGVGLNSRIHIVLEAGEYILEARDLGRNWPGHYTISVVSHKDIPPPAIPLAVGQPFTTFLHPEEEQTFYVSVLQERDLHVEITPRYGSLGVPEFSIAPLASDPLDLPARVAPGDYYIVVRNSSGEAGVTFTLLVE